MKLRIDGKLNHYYVQTLCMMLFPGVKFSEDEVESPETTVAHVKTEPLLHKTDGAAKEYGIRAEVMLRHAGKCASSVHEMAYSVLYTHEKTEKIAVGHSLRRGVLWECRCFESGGCGYCADKATEV